MNVKDESAKHTMGPWEMHEGQWGWHDSDEGGFYILMGGDGRNGTVNTVHLLNYADGRYAGDVGYEEAKANARLIAAAPELFEAALTYFQNYCLDEAEDVENCVGGSDQHEAAKALKAALSKAGAQP